MSTSLFCRNISDEVKERVLCQMYPPQFQQQQQQQQQQPVVPHDNNFIDLVHLNDNRSVDIFSTWK